MMTGITAIHTIEIVDLVASLDAGKEILTGRKYEFTAPGWWKHTHTMNRTYGFARECGLVAVVGCVCERDGLDWLHVSMSRAERSPTYADMVAVKHDFVGRNREAYQVFPPENRHVNDHPYCLHLWCRLDGAPVLPDFRKAGTI